MRIYTTNDGLLMFDSSEQPIVIAFANDKERLQFANNILKMAPREGLRLFAEHPATPDAEADTETLFTIIEQLEKAKK